MVAGFQEEVSQENQEEAESPFMTSPQIQGKEIRPHFSVGRVSKVVCNKSMLDVRFYYGHFWKIQSTRCIGGKGGISNSSWVWMKWSLKGCMWEVGG